MKPVVIAGAGVSGLAAGVGLAELNIPVIVLEQRPYPGGRAYSFTDAETGTVIDNGQHVLIAGYHRTMHLLEKIGTRKSITVQSQPSILLHHPQKGFGRFRIPPLPPPWHAAAGILTFPLMPLNDRLALLRARKFIMGNPELDAQIAGWTIDRWLDHVGQSAEARISLWEPLAVSIMNERTTHASALLFSRALRQAFLENRHSASMAIPTVGLSALYAAPAKEFIERNGGTVRCNADVEAVNASGQEATSVVLRGGETIDCSACILSVPSDRVRSLLPEILREAGYLAGLENLPVSPIVSLHLWFSKNFTTHTFFGLIGRRVQWVFNKSLLNAEQGPGGHVSAVISAAHDFVSLSNDDLVRIAVEDLRSTFGAVIGSPRHAVVIREKRATISPSPEAEPMRPANTTPFSNLFLAGDWTATGLPATIEGAIVSAENCVTAVKALMAAGGK